MASVRTQIMKSDKNNLQEIGAWGAGGIHKKQTLFFGFTFLEMFAKVRTTAVYKYGA